MGEGEAGSSWAIREGFPCDAIPGCVRGGGGGLGTGIAHMQSRSHRGRKRDGCEQRQDPFHFVPLPLLISLELSFLDKLLGFQNVLSKDLLPHCEGAVDSPSSGPLPGLQAWQVSDFIGHNVPLLDCVCLKGMNHILFIIFFFFSF